MMATQHEKGVFKCIREIVRVVMRLQHAYAYNDKHVGYRRLKFRWNDDWNIAKVAEITFLLGVAEIPVLDIRVKDCRYNGPYMTGEKYKALVIKIPLTLEPACVYNKEVV